MKIHINIEHKEALEDMIKFSEKCENDFKRMDGINAMIVKKIKLKHQEVRNIMAA